MLWSFGPTASGDHMSSIEMVVSKKAEVAVVDSLSLSNYLTRHYYQEPELHLQVSWGPLPPHPIIFNSKLPGELFLNTWTHLGGKFQDIYPNLLANFFLELLADWY